jgi:hypothetical protein
LKERATAAELSLRHFINLIKGKNFLYKYLEKIKMVGTKNVKIYLILVQGINSYNN